MFRLIGHGFARALRALFADQPPAAADARGQVERGEIPRDAIVVRRYRSTQYDAPGPADVLSTFTIRVVDGRQVVDLAALHEALGALEDARQWLQRWRLEHNPQRVASLDLAFPDYGGAKKWHTGHNDRPRQPPPPPPPVT